MGMTWRNLRTLIAFIFIAECAGILCSFFTISAIPTWYAGLVKPALNPPSWIFGPVWTTLYALMGISVFLVWKQYSNVSNDLEKLARWKRALRVFSIQLVLNVFWSILFFGLHNPALALVDIGILLVSIVVTMKLFYPFSKTATYLLVPYVLWVSFATYLNYSIWILN